MDSQCGGSGALFAWRRGGRASISSQQRANGGFVSVPVIGAEQVADLSAVFGIEERCGNRAAPSRQDRLDKRGLATGLLAVVGKYRLVSRDKAPGQNQVAVVI